MVRTFLRVRGALWCAWLVGRDVACARTTGRQPPPRAHPVPGTVEERPAKMLAGRVARTAPLVEGVAFSRVSRGCRRGSDGGPPDRPVASTTAERVVSQESPEGSSARRWGRVVRASVGPSANSMKGRQKRAAAVSSSGALLPLVCSSMPKKTKATARSPSSGFLPRRWVQARWVPSSSCIEPLVGAAGHIRAHDAAIRRLDE